MKHRTGFPGTGTQMSTVVISALLLVMVAALPARAQLSGNYTIGGTSPSYASFTAAVSALSVGVSGPVVFKVRPGTYSEHITIPNVTGASSTNTITFESETGVATSVILTYTAPSTADNWVIQFDGAKYLRIKNMTLTNAGTAGSVVVRFGANLSNYNLVEGCVMNGLTTTSSAADFSLVYMTANHTDNIFRNNQMNGGSNGIYATSGTNTVVEGNTMIGAAQSGCWYSAVYNPTVSKNLIKLSETATITQYGLYFNTIYTGFLVEKNKIMLLGTSGTKRGFQFWNSSITPMGLIANNFITCHGGTTTSYCFYVSTSGGKKLYNNTFCMLGSGAAATPAYIYWPRAQGMESVNNIYKNVNSGYAFYYNDYNGTYNYLTSSDYNAYWSTSPTPLFWGSTTYPNLAAMVAITNKDQHSIWNNVLFQNVTQGDLHLGGTSQNDMSLTGIQITGITDDIDGDTRVIPYRGADEACFLMPSWVSYSVTDANGQPVSFLTTPGTVYVDYAVNAPDYEADVVIKIRFISVTTNAVAYEETINGHKNVGQPLTGREMISLPASLQVGFYRVQAVFTTKNSCGFYRDYTVPQEQSFLMVDAGMTPCVVWPGDVNNDGACNYGDRAALNRYIFDANLRTTWLRGPARYQADVSVNPLTYVNWKPQASAPWYTPEGCYMDSDGNGMVNNFDYIAMRLNWLRTHAASPKTEVRASATVFALDQNYPNPFNPSTVLQYSAPERSAVLLTVVDALGRTVATLVEQTVESGVYQVTFDGTGLPSGLYYARISMSGTESGAAFGKTVKMTLSK